MGAGTVTPVIDAHVHLWNDPTRAYAWLEAPERSMLRRPIGPEELQAEQATAHVDGAILVEGGAGQEFELPELLTMADQSGAVSAVVGWIDLEWPDLCERVERARELRGGDFLTGLRAHISRQEDLYYIERPSVQRGLDAVGDTGLVFDLIARPEQLPIAARVIRSHPNLRTVLTHMAAPTFLPGEPMRTWRALVQEFGELDNVVGMKISGFACDARLDEASVRSYVEIAVDLFGPHRTMLGTDWPGSLVAGNNYATAWAMALEALPVLSEAELTAVVGGTAAQVYRVAL